MSTGEWFEAVVGFVIPTAAVVWGVWILWHWYRPGATRQSGGLVAGVVGFVLTCVLVMLIILGWELFKTWRHPARPPVAAAGGPVFRIPVGCADRLGWS
jgi:hypothetical protein